MRGEQAFACVSLISVSTKHKSCCKATQFGAINARPPQLNPPVPQFLHFLVRDTTNTFPPWRASCKAGEKTPLTFSSVTLAASQRIPLAMDYSPYQSSPALAAVPCRCQQPALLIPPPDPAAELSREGKNARLDANGFAPLAKGQDEL